MIKLKDILKESGVVGMVPAAGQLWPFSETESYAEKWYESRMKAILKKSLEGSTVVGTMMQDNTIDDNRALKRAGDSKDTHAKGLSHDSLPGWTVVKDPHPFSKGHDYKHHQTTLHPEADDGPLEHPPLPIVHTKKRHK